MQYCVYYTLCIIVQIAYYCSHFTVATCCKTQCSCHGGTLELEYHHQQKHLTASSSSSVKGSDFIIIIKSKASDNKIIRKSTWLQHHNHPKRGHLTSSLSSAKASWTPDYSISRSKSKSRAMWFLSHKSAKKIVPQQQFGFKVQLYLWLSLIEVQILAAQLLT